MDNIISGDSKEIAETLLSMQSRYNEGRGVECVRAVATFLLRGQLKEAESIARWDGDKIRNYPDIEAYIRQSFPAIERDHKRFEAMFPSK